MTFDVKEIVSEVVEKIKSDENFRESFEKDPVRTIEKIIGVDLPDGSIDEIKAKVGTDWISNALEGLGSLFGKNNLYE